MMEPPAPRYTETADGASIAYWTLGSEPPVILHLSDAFAPSFATMLEEPSYRPYFEGLRGEGTLVAFDFRGVGASQRAAPQGIADFIADIVAVVDALESPDVVLAGAGIGTLVAAEYAAAHTGSISHLVLYGPQLSGTALDTALADVYDLARTNYALGVEGLWQLGVRWGGDSNVRSFAQHVVRENPPESAFAYLEAVRGSDLSLLLPLFPKPKLIRRARRIMRS